MIKQAVHSEIEQDKLHSDFLMEYGFNQTDRKQKGWVRDSAE